MFRKMANIFVLFLFVVSTTGFTISKHYCHGNLVSVSINAEAKSCCGMNGNDCCKNENEFFQLKNDFTASSYTIVIVNPSISIELFSINLNVDQLSEAIKEMRFNYVANGPPFNDQQFTYYIRQFKLAPPIC